MPASKRHKLVIESMSLETPHTVLLRLQDEQGLVAASHLLEGQYVELAVAGEKTVLALASGPGLNPVEFLLRRDSELGVKLGACKVGDNVEIGAAQGPGFPLAETRGCNLYLMCVGTGVSALRPVVQTVIAERDAWKRVVLLYGARAPADFAFASEFPEWQKQHVEVRLATSRSEPTFDDGHRGYVQDLARGLRLPLEDAHVFACGSAAMVQAVETTFEELGLKPERFHTNLP